jgi:hypothetical protein
MDMSPILALLLSALGVLLALALRELHLLRRAIWATGSIAQGLAAHCAANLNTLGHALWRLHAWQRGEVVAPVATEEASHG